MVSKSYDNFKFSGKVPKLGTDYDESESTFTIYNVPILAEMTQTYSDGIAYKAADEILKVEVNNVPLTIVDASPTHPEHFKYSNTQQKAQVSVGYMSEPSKPKDGMSKTKRYADFVLFNTPKIDSLKQAYFDGNIIDTSIGFEFNLDETPGAFNGKSYDYVQRDIKLDHNAILIDAIGRIGQGRMPSPIGGIGADKKMKANDEMITTAINDLAKQLTKDNPDLNRDNILKLIDKGLDGLLFDGISETSLSPELRTIGQEISMNNKDVSVDEAFSLMSATIWQMRFPNDTQDFKSYLNKKINSEDRMTEDLQKQVDALTLSNDNLKKEIATFKKLSADEMTKAMDDMQVESDKLKVEKADLEKELGETKDSLKVYTDKDEEALQTKRDAVKKAYPEFDELFDKADAEYIEKKFDEMEGKKEKADKKDIGADMMGMKKVQKSEQKSFNSVYGNKPKKKEDE